MELGCVRKVCPQVERFMRLVILTPPLGSAAS